MTTLPDLRRTLIVAKDDLRTTKENHETVKAICEQRAINGGATGKNAEERERALLIALDGDKEYARSRNALRKAEYEVDRINAEITILEDERKARELSCREENNRVLDRLAAAYERMAPANPVRAAIDTALPF